MRTFFIFLIIFSINISLFAQIFPVSTDGKSFDSIFQNLKDGAFHGKVSGEFRIVNLSGDTAKLSFDGEKALLQIQPDPDEVYDISSKVYSCGNEQATIKYSTYAFANAFEVIMHEKAYGISLIDGGCDLVIKELKYVYKETGKQEMLYLFFTGNIGLYQPKNCGIPQIFIQAGSILVFTIDKPISKKL